MVSPRAPKGLVALVQLLVPCKRMRIVPTQQLAARLILSASIAFYRGLPGSAIDLLSPPQWVMTDNGAELQRMTDANSKLQDKAARRVYDSGLELADKGADRETQFVDDSLLRKAEERFALLIDELAPNYYGAYANRANVRVARGNYVGAVADYEAALRLAPLAKDAWITYLNLGATLIAADRAPEALDNMERAVRMSKDDRLALLGRGNAYHALGKWGAAAADHGAALEKNPSDIQPFWIRYALELFEARERRPEALGIIRRVAAKYDLEPEAQLAACSMLWDGGNELEQQEALRRWNYAPLTTRRSMATLDVRSKQWPPTALLAANNFRAAAPEVPVELLVEAPKVEQEASLKSATSDPSDHSPAAALDEKALRLDEIRKLKQQIAELQGLA